MPLQHQKKQAIESIQDRFVKILKYDLEKNLIRKEELGASLNFEQLRKPITNFLNTIEKVKDFNLANISLPQLNNFNKHLGDGHAILLLLSQFSTGIDNPTVRRQRLLEDVEDVLDKFIDAAKAIEIRVETDNPLKRRIDAEETVSRLNELIEGVKFDSQKKEKEINQILESAKSAAGKVGVASHSYIFKEEADEHAKIAKNWLIAIWITLGVTCGIAVTFFFMLFSNSAAIANVNPIQFAISKVVILTIFFIVVSICTKNYKAHKHNAIVNKHRQNALNTFETFVKAAGNDEQTKNAVLLQATQSIFAGQNTGYNSAENENDMPSKIIEIVKSTGSKSQNN